MCCLSGKTDKHTYIAFDEYWCSSETLLESKRSGKVHHHFAKYCTGSNTLRRELSHDLLLSLGRDLLASNAASADRSH